MVVYLVTGASRGLGYEFLRQLSQGNNTVFGLVRTKAAAEKKVSEDGLKNIHIISADVTDTASLRAARAEVEKISPVIDVLINNAAAITPRSAFNSLSDFEDAPEVLEEEMNINYQTNVLGVIKTINTFLPLVKKSSIKKVISISTGLADDALTNEYDLYEAAPYSISKAALNTAVAKYNARHGKSSDGILFLSISPGLVNTGNDAARKCGQLCVSCAVCADYDDSSARLDDAPEVCEGLSSFHWTYHTRRVGQGCYGCCG